MPSISKRSLYKYLAIVPGSRSDYEQLARFHYCGPNPGPIRYVYKFIGSGILSELLPAVVGVIVYGPASANLAARNRATGGMFAGLDRSAALSLLNERLLCIRRVIIQPRYHGLGLATRLVRETLPMTGTPMIEAVSMIGRSHPFLRLAGMKEFPTPPDDKAERMKAALEAAGLIGALQHDSESVHAMIERLRPQQRTFIKNEMDRFCQKFTNRRTGRHSPGRTDFVLSKLSHSPAYYLWKNPEKEAIM